MPLACYVLCYSVSVSAPGRDRVAGPLLFLVLAGMVLTRQHETHSAARFVGPPGPGESDGRPSRYRRIVVGAAVAVAVTALVAVVVPALPGMSRAPASLHHPAPTVAGLVVDPVDAMAALRDGTPKAPAYDVLQVDLNAPSTGYLAVAVLDSYDGALWHFDATFEPTGGRIPAAPGAGRNLTSTPVTQRVGIERALPVQFLPALDRPATVSGLPVAADAGSGMILPDEQTSGRFEYSVTSLAPTASLASVSPADGIGSTSSSVGSVVSGSDISLPPGTSAAMGTTMKFLATLTGERPVATVGFLQSVLTALHSKERRIDPHLTPAPEAPATNAKGRPGARAPGLHFDGNPDNRGQRRHGEHGRHVSLRGGERHHGRPHRHPRAVRHPVRHGGSLPGCSGPGRHRVSDRPDIRRWFGRGRLVPGDESPGLGLGRNPGRRCRLGGGGPDP